MGIENKIKKARTEISLDELLKGDRAMMKKIEKDTKLVTAEKKIMQYACFSIILGIIILILGELFDGNPVIDFIKGAAPWVLLAFSFLFSILYINKLEEK